MHSGLHVLVSRVGLIREGMADCCQLIVVVSHRGQHHYQLCLIKTLHADGTHQHRPPFFCKVASPILFLIKLLPNSNLCKCRHQYIDLFSVCYIMTLNAKVKLAQTKINAHTFIQADTQIHITYTYIHTQTHTLASFV